LSLVLAAGVGEPVPETFKQQAGVGRLGLEVLEGVRLGQELFAPVVQGTNLTLQGG